MIVYAQSRFINNGMIMGGFHTNTVKGLNSRVLYNTDVILSIKCNVCYLCVNPTVLNNNIGRKEHGRTRRTK